MNGKIHINHVESSADKAAIARLLYKDDDKFVPVTPLATLNKSANFLKATMDGKGPIGAATSHDQWLRGCDASMSRDCVVFELASSIVHKPFGGFKEPLKTLHHVFTFARLITIMAGYLSDDGDGVSGQISVIAAIAAGNIRSRGNMESIGMEKIASWPQWLDYEHRTWFPKLADTTRDPTKEAVYLWFPPAAVKAFMLDIEPYVTGVKLLERKKLGDASVIEKYGVKLDEIGEYEELVDRYGSITTAVRDIPYDALFVGPPDLARLDKDHVDQPDKEVVF